MKRVIQIVILVLVFLALMVGTMAWPASGDGPTFTTTDREFINGYYKRLLGNLAPGSVNRSGFLPPIERDLVPGGYLPKSLERELKALPQDLASELSPIDSGYERYKIGPHVIL